MGDVMMQIRVYPEGDADLSTIKARVQEIGSVKETKEEPIAFGLKVLNVTLVMPDGEQNVEEKISAIEGVQNVEVLKVTLI